MMHAFKTRGSARSNAGARICHDGSIATLEEVVEHYDGAARTGQAGPT